MPTGRYQLLDLVRGLTIISMVGYHAVWDLVNLFDFDWEWFDGAAAYVWQQSICWVFILLAGFCWGLGRRPLRRGLTVLAAGVLIAVVTYLVMPEQRILFGVLILIGSCMVLTIPLDPLLKRLPPSLGLLGSALLFVLLRDVNAGYLGFEGLTLVELPGWLYAGYPAAYLGFPGEGFLSTDYFSLLPWCFLFLVGYFLYRLTAGALASWSPMMWRCRPLEWVGRHSLLIYLLHQPVLYGALYLIFEL